MPASFDHIRCDQTWKAKSGSLEVTVAIISWCCGYLAGRLQPVEGETPVLVEAERAGVGGGGVDKVGVEPDVEGVGEDGRVGADAEAVEGGAAEAICEEGGELRDGFERVLGRFWRQWNEFQERKYSFGGWRSTLGPTIVCRLREASKLIT